MIDFGQCFITGSLAGGSLRRVESITRVVELCFILDQFVRCRNEWQPVPTHQVCHACSMNLLLVADNSDEYIASASRISRAIAEAPILRMDTNFRPLAKSCSGVLKNV